MEAEQTPVARKTSHRSRTAHLVGVLAYWILVCVLAFCLFIRFLTTSGIGVNGKATFEKALTGTAYRPYAFRVLLPTLANALAPYVDGRWALKMGRQSEIILGERFFRARLNGRLYPRQVVLLLCMMYLSLLGFLAAFQGFVSALGFGPKSKYLLPIAVLLVLPAFFGFGYMYDFTLLFLFTLGLWLMATQHWSAYLLVFVLGALNKETTIFLTLVFLIYYWPRMPRARWVSLASIQVATWVLIQAILHYHFRNNPGGALEWHFDDQVATYANLASTRPGLLMAWIASLALICVLVLHNWRKKPSFPRTALTILPFFLFLFVFWAYPLEIRDLYEALPILAVLMLPAPSMLREHDACSVP
jgi:hypothetical protein